MSRPRWTSGLWICALLCLQAQSTLAAELERPPVPLREAAAPALLSSSEVPSGMALPYGVGYEQRMRAAGSQNEPANPATGSASQGAGASRGASSSGSGNTGGRGNGGAGRGR